MDKSPESIDWSLTTWEGSRREELRRWAALSLDAILAAQEEMAELAETFVLKSENERSTQFPPAK